MSTQKINIPPPPFHDVGIAQLLPTPSTVSPGTPVTIIVGVRDRGTFLETFNLTLNYGSPAKNVLLEPGKQIVPLQTVSYNYTIDTTGYAIGVYTVIATVRIPVSNNTADQTSTVLFTVAQSSTSPFFYVIGGIAAGAVAAVVAGVFLKRRRAATQRRREDSS
jgi:hypothetical protein